MSQEPATLVIYQWAVDRLAALQAASVTTAHSALPLYAEDWSKINVAYAGEDAFDEWTSLDAKGQSLEIDVEVSVREVADEDEPLVRAKRISAKIEESLLENIGHHKINGATVRIEKAGEEADVTNDDNDQSFVRLTLQFTLLHRVRRGDPYTLI
jgi:hypothetical protein